MTRSAQKNLLVSGLMVFLGVLSWMIGIADQSPLVPRALAASEASEADIAALRERAAAFWAARVAGDPDGQWRLLEPRGKGRVTAQEYGAPPQGGKYLTYQIEEATIHGLFATVKVRVLVQQILPESVRGPTLRPRGVVLDDGWIRIGGVWYRRLDPDGPIPAGSHQP